MSDKKEISKLKKKIADLRADAGEDVYYSYREAAQTDMMLHEYEKRLKYLEEKHDNNDEKILYIEVEDEKGDRRKFSVTTGSPDPSNGIISKDSRIGKELSKGEVGDEVMIGDSKYLIISKNI